MATFPLRSDNLGADELLVKVTNRPIHVGDVHFLEGLSQAGPVSPIAKGSLRTPGLEGVGIIVRLGKNAEAEGKVTEGKRVAFFPSNGSWAEYVIVKSNSILPLPNDIPDQIAAHVLINTITASILIQTGHNSLKPPIKPPVYILQNAAASAVGRLLTQIALDRGVRPIRLVRSSQSAEKLTSALPGGPVISTDDQDWKKQVRDALEGHKLEVAFDALGGKAIDDLAEIVDEGATIINFGSLESNEGTNIFSLSLHNATLRSIHIRSWFRLSDSEKQKDFELALSLAKEHPQLFQVATEFEFEDFQRAIKHVFTPGKGGMVLLKNSK
jgi:NADPH:quinone reductase-like Zn-dependent oxidoreductase